MNVWEIVLPILSGLAVCIPVVVKLVQYVIKACKGQNWNDVVKLVMKYMAVAENKFSKGADRKEWVLAMVKASADTVNYPLDDAAMAKVAEMIDEICAAAKVINVEAPAPADAE